MYLSRVSLDLSRLESLAFVSSPYKIHAAVEQAFSPQVMRETSEGRILWRLDEVPQSRFTSWLYVLSPEKPDFTAVCKQAGETPTSSWITKDYTPVMNRIVEGQLWQFRLKANPVRKVLVDKGRKGREGIVGTIQGHVTEAQQCSWLLDRAESHGFQIAKSKEGFERLVISHRRRENFKRKQSIVTLSTAQFDGVLTVTNAELFRHALGFGIGRARGFGCGLMTIAPFQESGND